MSDRFDIVVHGCDDPVIDSKIEVSEHSFFMASEHLSEI